MRHRIVVAGLLALLVLLCAPAAGALAQPSLTIESPRPGLVTKEQRPIFRGTTTDPLDVVTVEIYTGESPFTSAEAFPESSGAWSAQPSTPLPDGAYGAIAEQMELATSESGSSEAVGFTIDTKPPKVSLNALSSPTNDTTPSFSGTASDTEPVTVYIFKGASASGTPVATAQAEGTGDDWNSDAASPPLADGTYTAVAEQESSLGNGPGFSKERNFTVDTSSPEVTLNAPSSPTGDDTPSFSGRASDTTEVVVYIFSGESIVATARASGDGGDWSSGPASPQLADGTYEAIAEQTSSLGNEPGFSKERSFTVDTKPPEVTLNAVSSPTNDKTPSFSGKASDNIEPVTVYVFKGATASGTPVATAHATGTGGPWTSGGASPSLA
ncbi:MAG: Ig-like domain-containing protein, partial [Solirubrobacteraceae bacterium]